MTFENRKMKETASQPDTEAVFRASGDGGNKQAEKQQQLNA
jgi:hypothetical protein